MEGKVKKQPVGNICLFFDDFVQFTFLEGHSENSY